ncbi:hypothetical protein BaRGS_00036006, partial [Batillaria attramentaria]
MMMLELLAFSIHYHPMQKCASVGEGCQQSRLWGMALGFVAVTQFHLHRCA